MELEIYIFPIPLCQGSASVQLTEDQWRPCRRAKEGGEAGY